MKLWCADGCVIDGKPYYKTREFNRQPDETHCPECGARLETGMERNARKKAASRNGRLRNQSEAESRAAEEFHDLVAPTGEICWALTARPEHTRCSGRIEAHHILPLDWWRQKFGDLPEDELLALMYAPIIGAPLCGGFHAAVTPSVGGRKDYIYFNELDRELIEHCERLDLEYPNRGVLARLQFECPIREAAA